MQDLITCNQAARRLGVHVATIRGWIREGRVPAYRLGQRFTRVNWGELLDALSEQRDDRDLSKAGKDLGITEESCAKLREVGA